jgi:hypothetical protein
MSKIKFTGTNIAAAILVLFYFFPWVSFTVFSMSGLSITTHGISPGMFSYVTGGLSRIYMILAIIVPLCGALILYQNITGNQKFAKYYKLAHYLPAIYLIVGIIGMHFKMKPDIPEGMGDAYNQMASGLNDMAPGVFDVLSFAAYLSIIAGVYLILVSIGTIKDKEYIKPATPPASPDNKSSNPEGGA